VTARCNEANVRSTFSHGIHYYRDVRMISSRPLSFRVMSVLVAQATHAMLVGLHSRFRVFAQLTTYGKRMTRRDGSDL